MRRTAFHNIFNIDDLKEMISITEWMLWLRFGQFIKCSLLSKLSQISLQVITTMSIWRPRWSSSRPGDCWSEDWRLRRNWIRVHRSWWLTEFSLLWFCSRTLCRAASSWSRVPGCIQECLDSEHPGDQSSAVYWSLVPVCWHEVLWSGAVFEDTCHHEEASSPWSQWRGTSPAPPSPSAPPPWTGPGWTQTRSWSRRTWWCHSRARCWRRPEQCHHCHEPGLIYPQHCGTSHRGVGGSDHQTHRPCLQLISCHASRSCLPPRTGGDAWDCTGHCRTRGPGGQPAGWRWGSICILLLYTWISWVWWQHRDLQGWPRWPSHVHLSDPC